MKASKEEVATTVIHRDNMVRGSGSNVQAIPARESASKVRDTSRGQGSASSASNTRQGRDSSRTRSGRNEVITPGLKRLADTEDDEIWGMAKEDNRYTQAWSREMEEDFMVDKNHGPKNCHIIEGIPQALMNQIRITYRTAKTNITSKEGQNAHFGHHMNDMILLFAKNEFTREEIWRRNNLHYQGHYLLPGVCRNMSTGGRCVHGDCCKYFHVVTREA